MMRMLLLGSGEFIGLGTKMMQQVATRSGTYMLELFSSGSLCSEPSKISTESSELCYYGKCTGANLAKYAQAWRRPCGLRGLSDCVTAA